MNHSPFAHTRSALRRTLRATLASAIVAASAMAAFSAGAQQISHEVGGTRPRSTVDFSRTERLNGEPPLIKNVLTCNSGFVPSGGVCVPIPNQAAIIKSWASNFAGQSKCVAKPAPGRQYTWETTLSSYACATINSNGTVQITQTAGYGAPFSYTSPDQPFWNDAVSIAGNRWQDPSLSCAGPFHVTYSNDFSASPIYANNAALMAGDAPTGWTFTYNQQLGRQAGQSQTDCSGPN